MNQQHNDRDKAKQGGDFQKDRERATEAGRKNQQSQGGKPQREFEQQQGGQRDRDMERDRQHGGGMKQGDQE